ncbi:hypothetical protein DRN74_05350, partial [Candidatus Micrarchaeota archaeon]
MSTIEKNNVSSNIIGMCLRSSDNNTLANNTFYNNYLDLKSSESPDNTLVHNLFGDTWASFSYSGAIEVNSSSAPASDPPGWHNISKYLSIINQTSAWINLSIHYNDSDLRGMDESTLRLLKHTVADWELVPESGVNTTENVVYANITSFSIFAPFGKVKDIIVEDISWIPTNISEGDTVTFNATIKNNGTGNISRTFYNTFYLDGSSIGGISVNGLSAGSSIDIIKTWTAKPGSHIIEVFADSNNDIFESNETNNNRSKSLLIEPADLIVEDIIWTPTTINDGDSVTFTATIKNNGTGNASVSFYNTFYIDGNLIGGEWVNGLSAGNSINVTQTWTATPGNHTIKVKADSEDNIFEAIETNNEKIGSIYVTNYSLGVISPNGGEIWYGTQEIKWNVTIEKNQSEDLRVDIELYNGKEFMSIAKNISNTGVYEWNTKTVNDGTYLVKITAYSDKITLTDFSDAWFMIHNSFSVDLSSTPTSSQTTEYKNSSYRIKITSKEPFTDNFTILVNNIDEASVVDLSQNHITLGAFDNEIVVLTVTDAVPGTYRVEVTVVSETNTSVKDEITITTEVLPAFDVDISAQLRKTSVGGNLTYNVEIYNRQSVEDTFNISISGISSDWYSIESEQILFGGERKNIPLLIHIPESASAGNYTVTVFVTSSNIGKTRNTSKPLNVVLAPIIYDLKPNDNTITGSTDILITWRTSANSTTVAFVKKKEEAEWTYICGEPGINHVILLSNLTRNTWYEFYVTSNSTRASSVSGVRSIYVDNGIVFTKRNYSSTVERDYDQRIKISIKNTDSKLHTVLVSIINPYEDIIAGFVGEGSQDQIINLAPSEVKEVTLAIHAQDADEEDYVLLLNLTNIGEEIKDYAYLNLHVRQPIINFVLEEVSTDQYTLTKKLRLRNLGDTITDFKVYVSEELEDKVILQPNIEHMRLPSGGATLFDASPLLHENFTGISGKVIAPGAGANVSLNVSFTPPEGKSVFSGNVGGALCNFTRETPGNISIWAEQILEGVASVGIAAQYNNSCCALVMDNISIIGNMIIIDVDSLVDKDSEENLTSVHEWLTLTNLSYGNYIVKVREIELGELANQSLEMKPVGMFFEEDNLTGRLYTFRGDISNTSSLVPFPLVPPPRYFNEAAFWINSTDTIILAIDMSNSGVETCKVNFSLSPENTSISINPDNYSVSIEGNTTELLLFEIETTSLQYGIYNLTYSLDYQCEYNASFTRTLPVGIYEVNQSWEDDSFVVQVQSPFNDTFSKKTWDWTNTPWGWIPMHTDYTITFSNLSQSNLLLLPRTDVISLCNGISEVVISNEMQNYGDDFSAHWGASGSAYAGYIGGSVVSSTHGQFFEPIPFRYSATKVSREVVLPGLKYVFSGLIVTAFVPSSSVAELVMVETEGLPFAFRISLSLGTCIGVQETAQNVVERVIGGDGGAHQTTSKVKINEYPSTHQTTSKVKINEYPSMMAFFNPWYQLRRDSDGDGLPDLVEKSTGYNPFSPLSCPGAEASTRNGDWYCNNRPRISVPFETHIPAPDQINDLVDPYLIVRFKRGRSGVLSDVKPHNLRILFNGQEIGRLTNTIPEGYYIFYVDPALLNIKSDVSRNVVSLITTHHNPGHYIVSTDMRLVFVFDNINIKVFASNQGEANQIVADKFKAAKRKPDFGVCAETVSLSNDPAVGIETAINVKLYNLGTVGMRNVLMQAFDNDVLIEEKVIPFVYLMSSQNVSFSWVPSSSGRHVIKVKVNPEQSIKESDFTNNEATKEVNVAAGDEGPPVISQPTPANWLKTRKKRPSISAKFSDDYSGINILSVKLFLDSIDVTDVANVSATEITYAPAEDLDDGLHNVTVYVEDNPGKASSLSWVFIVDTNPPASISNLSAVDKGATWILWNWNNPTDDDFDHVEIWINDTWRENVTHMWHVYNATGLNPNTTYKIIARAVDDVGNINETWINESAKTLPLEEDNDAPVISNVIVANITINSATIAWDTDEVSDSLVKYGTESGNHTLQVHDSSNVISHNIELTGLMASTIYYFVVNSTDLAGNSNESTEYNFTTIPVIDTTPPASITNLQNTTGQTWINWTWTNPPDTDFSHVVVYLDGIWQANTSNNFYNTTGLSPETSYEIGTHTVDTTGNINTTWINQTTKTQAGKDTTPPSVTNPTATPSGIIADGIQKSQLNVTVTDESGIASVTLDLSDIGGSPAQEMNNIPGTDVYTVTTTAAVGTAPDTYYLQINATDIYGNS